MFTPTSDKGPCQRVVSARSLFRRGRSGSSRSTVSFQDRTSIEEYTLSRQDVRPAIPDATSTAPPQGLRPQKSQPGLRTRIGDTIEGVPFRHKLNILVSVPVLVISILFAVIVSAEIDTAQSAGSQADLVRASGQVARLIDDLETEHQQAIRLRAAFDARNPRDSGPVVDMYRSALQATGAQTDVVRSTFGAALPDMEANALSQVGALDQVRDQIATGQLPANDIDNAYGSCIGALVDGLGLTGNTDGDQRLSQRLDALMRADAAHADFETNLLSAQSNGSNSLIEFLGAISGMGEYTNQVSRFTALATPKQVSELGGMEHNSDQTYLSTQFAVLEVSTSDLGNPLSPADQDKAVQQVEQTYTRVFNESATRLAITESLTRQIAAAADDNSSTAWWRAILLLLLALAIFATWVTLSVLIRHSVVRPVQRLTTAARKVAAITDQELSRVADDDAVDESPARLEALPVLAKDELGALAIAFNRVQVTAADLLERQVVSRRNIAEMFGNIGRRVSNLTTRQLTLIDAVERGETDPELLEQLYRIDHIAVRMQRNADSLMLLAGIRESELDGRPAPVSHVVRAALGQIEGYQRVSLRAEADPTVSPDIVGDLVLMLAELLENAASFSPAHSGVEVNVRSAEDGAAVLEVVDHGLGLGSDRMAEENARLVRRERLDLVPTKVLGLVVVGTLARRWGVLVTLGRTPGGGLTAQVTVPAALLSAAAAAPAAAPAVPAALSVPTRPTTPAAATAPTAAAPTPAPIAPASDAAASTPATSDAAAPGAAPADAPAPAVPAATAPGTATTTAASSPTGPPHSPVLPPAVEGGLPRRAPRRAADEPVHSHSEAPEPTPADAARPGAAPADAARPEGLRRRVRGATLQQARQSRPTAPAPVRLTTPEQEAEAARASLEEFEEAVDRAERESTLTNLRINEHTAPQELPEGVGP
jgi:signal transduction histidine kinase